MLGVRWIARAMIIATTIMWWTSARGQITDPTVSLYVRDALCRDIEPGTKVRLHVEADDEAGDSSAAAGYATMIGTLESCRDGVLVLRPEKTGADTARVPMEQVLSLEVSRGRSSYILPGALVGLFVGLVASSAAQTNHHEDEFLGGLSDMEDNINRGIGITIVTTMVGGVIGAAMGGEEWESVYDLQVGGSYGTGLQGDYQVAVAVSF